tara:strand:+ start:6573 stop:7721 length:1149 start_codon:yes stop_codon:yes gene_type:complete
MKIGILTLPLHTNYGGNLQAYALMKTLSDLGHEPYFLVRKKNKKKLYRVPLSFLKRSVQKYFLGKSVALFPELYEKNIYRAISINTEIFLNQRILPKSKVCYTSGELNAETERLGLDAIVVGSDQVWRPKYAPTITDYYLGFLKENSEVKRMAYAASFGTSNWEYDHQDYICCKRLIKKFDAISVREHSAVSLCKEYFEMNAEHLLDPTMLINLEDYIGLIGNEYEDYHQECLITYILDENPEAKKIIDYLEGFFYKNAVRINAKTEDKDAKLEERIAPPVEQWLASFVNASFVITDSFHACVFAILFKKPFLVYGNVNRGLSRFESLLEMFSLESRLVLNGKEGDLGLILNQEIDWDSVHSTLAFEKEKAFRFIQSYLKSV